MKRVERKIALRCAVYTRVSTDSGLEQDFNSNVVSGSFAQIAVIRRQRGE